MAQSGLERPPVGGGVRASLCRTVTWRGRAGPSSGGAQEGEHQGGRGGPAGSGESLKVLVQGCLVGKWRECHQASGCAPCSVAAALPAGQLLVCKDFEPCENTGVGYSTTAFVTPTIAFCLTFTTTL